MQECKEKYKVNVTPNALENVKRIMDFYIDQVAYPLAAADFLRAFELKIPIFANNPYLYPVPKNLPNFEELGYRKAPLYKHHIILYIVDDESKTVHVIYVVDTRQNLWLETPISMELLK